jgi:hypothetical protein
LLVIITKLAKVDTEQRAGHHADEGHIRWENHPVIKSNEGMLRTPSIKT